jgi:hypothetical protein
MAWRASPIQSLFTVARTYTDVFFFFSLDFMRISLKSCHQRQLWRRWRRHTCGLSSLSFYHSIENRRTSRNQFTQYHSLLTYCCRRRQHRSLLRGDFVIRLVLLLNVVERECFAIRSHQMISFSHFPSFIV